MYAQDSWRATERLTVNYGLRYEYFTPLYDRDNLLTNIIPRTGEIVRAQDSGSVYDRTLIHPDRNDFAPRVGSVWSATPTLVAPRRLRPVLPADSTAMARSRRWGSTCRSWWMRPSTANAPTDAPAFTFARASRRSTPAP